MPARRGDLIVVCQIRSASFVATPGRGLEVSKLWHLGRVTKVDRDGYATEFEYHPIVGGLTRQTLRGRDGERFGKSLDGLGTLVESASKFDVDGILEAAAHHTYPGHPTQVAPFDSIGDVSAFVAPFRKPVTEPRRAATAGETSERTA